MACDQDAVQRPLGPWVLVHEVALFLEPNIAGGVRDSLSEPLAGS